jgi:choline dehydrogenase
MPRAKASGMPQESPSDGAAEEALALGQDALREAECLVSVSPPMTKKLSAPRSPKDRLLHQLQQGTLSRRGFLTLLGLSATTVGTQTLFGCGDASSEYDYIIVGAGSAGCTLAARLLTDSEARILLIEAGGSNDREEIRDFSQSWKLTLPGSETDWGYKSVPQRTLLNAPQSYSSGKVLGGSSSINGMVWVKGNTADFDGWAAEGCPGWDSGSVQSSFQALSQAIQPSTALTSRTALAQALLEAAAGLGHARNPDYNGGQQMGVGYTQLNVLEDGRRQDAFSAFVAPHADNPRLSLLMGARVKRISVRGKRADGVILEQDGAEQTLTANREVIVCAGTVHTPHLLMLSGIGGPAELERHGLPVVAAVPGVGQNLQDHLISVAARKLRQPEPASHTTAMDVSLFFGEGPRPGMPRFQVQTYYMRYGWAAYPSEAVAFGLIHLHPTSRGTVKLQSADFRDAPLIDPNFLATQEDWAHQLEGYKAIREMLAAPGLRDWVEEVEHTPGPEVSTDEQLLAALSKYSESDFHSVGTCRMGQDALAVVDPQLRVKGVERLRLASAAIIPTLPSGNTNAPSLMVGDRAGRLISMLSRIPDATVHVLARERGPVRDHQGLLLTLDRTLADCPPLDLLQGPGGPGQEEVMNDEAVLSSVQNHMAAGVVVDGNLISAAGDTAGSDGALQMGALLRGEPIAQRIQLEIQCAPQPPFHAGSPRTAPPEVLQAAREKFQPLTSAREKTARRVAERLGTAPQK